MRCVAKTKKGRPCKNKAAIGEYCSIHSPETTAGTGSKGIDKEELFQDILQYHTLMGLSIRETARQSKFSRTAIINNFDDYKQWLKEETDIIKDPDEMIKRALVRSEDRQNSLYLEQAKDGISTTDRVRLMSAMKGEDEFKIKLLQDLGVLDKQFDGVQVVNQITAEHFREAFNEAQKSADEDKS